MKNIFFLGFFLVVITVYSLGCWYVFHRVGQAIQSPLVRTVFSWVFWLLAASFIVGQILERGNPHLVSSIVSGIGSTWLAVLWYSFLLVLVVDVVRLLNNFLHFIPANFMSTHLTPVSLLVGGAVLIFIVVTAGYINAAYPRVHTIDVQVNKSVPGKKELTVALLSDVHMGFIIRNGRVSRMIDNINATHPDLVIFAGDLVDHNPKPVVQGDMGRHFAKIKAPLGVYAVTGNHEFIGHPEVSVDYLSQYGVKYLRDTLIDIAGIQLAGREDVTKKRFVGEDRKPLAELLQKMAADKPLILIDHQPVDYTEAQRLGVDLMLSGHTHEGQLWPFKILTQKIYGLQDGLMKRGNANFYVSPGYGTWGPPVRIGNRPEIALIRIHFR